MLSRDSSHMTVHYTDQIQNLDTDTILKHRQVSLQLPESQKPWTSEDGNADLAKAPSNLCKQDKGFIFRHDDRIIFSSNCTHSRVYKQKGTDYRG
jgi:hypothetical protein